MTTLHALHRAMLADEAIVQTYTADHLNASAFLNGWIDWPEAERRWKRTAESRKLRWRDRARISGLMGEFG